MPHFIVEHSANLAHRHDVKALARTIAAAAAETGVFPLAGIRVRFHPVETYVVADDHPDNAFVSVIVRLGAGRDMETKARAGCHVFDAITAFFGEDMASGHLAVSLDMDESVPETSFKANSIHQRLAQD